MLLHERAEGEGRVEAPKGDLPADNIPDEIVRYAHVKVVVCLVAGARLRLVVLVSDADLGQGVLEAVEEFSIRTRVQDARLEDVEESVELPQEAELALDLLAHSVEHEVLLVLELPKDHGQEGEKLGEPIDMHVIGHRLDLKAVVRPIQVVGL